MTAVPEEYEGFKVRRVSAPRPARYHMTGSGPDATTTFVFWQDEESGRWVAYAPDAVLLLRVAYFQTLEETLAHVADTIRAELAARALRNAPDGW